MGSHTYTYFAGVLHLPWDCANPTLPIKQPPMVFIIQDSKALSSPNAITALQLHLCDAVQPALCVEACFTLSALGKDSLAGA